jgi:L-threonylcarbamoyladenylate synthase
VVAFRTDTFYGLGADPLNVQAVRAIRQLKGREDSKPILLLISDASVVERYLENPSASFRGVAKRHWPGPITLIGKSKADISDELTASSGTIGLRLPDDENVRDLVRACGGALTATSANPAGREPARTADEVQSYFPEGLDLIVDSGEVTVSAPSTVVDLSTDRAKLIREGAISKQALADLL